MNTFIYLIVCRDILQEAYLSREFAEQRLKIFNQDYKQNICFIVKMPIQDMGNYQITQSLKESLYN